MKTAAGNRGRSFERIIDASQGVDVCLSRVAQAAKWVGPKVIAQRGPVDYTGTIVGPGRAICFDAKMCDLATRYPVGNLDHLPAHQRQYLILHGEAGALSGVLIWATKRAGYFWLPWHALRELNGVASVPWETPALINIGPDSRTVDFRRIPGVVRPRSVGTREYEDDPTFRRAYESELRRQP